MGYKTFQIVLDSPTGSYYSGSNVTGKIILVLEKPKKVRGLRIEFYGKARVSFYKTERHHHGVRTGVHSNRTAASSHDRVRYHAEEEYFCTKYYLIGSENGEVEIPAGEHVYPFSSALPPGLPTSYVGKHCRVKYAIKATLDRPWKIDEKTSLTLNVVTPVDLNLLPQVREPVRKETDKTFGFLAWKSGPLTLTVNIPYSGYTPAQAIVASIEVDNRTNVRISEVKCKLKKELKLISRLPHRKEQTESDNLVKVELDGVPPNGYKCWTQNIEIPEKSFLNFDTCSIIKVEYFLEVEVCATGAHTNLSLTIPITLGTVPIYQVNGLLQPAADPNEPPPPYPSLQFLPEPSAPLLEDLDF